MMGQDDGQGGALNYFMGGPNGAPF